MNLNCYGRTVAIIDDSAFTTEAELEALVAPYKVAERIVRRRFKTVRRWLPKRLP